MIFSITINQCVFYVYTCVCIQFVLYLVTWKIRCLGLYYSYYFVFSDVISKCIHKEPYRSSTKYTAVLFSKCQLCYIWEVICLYGIFFLNCDPLFLYFSYTSSIKVIIEWDRIIQTAFHYAEPQARITLKGFKTIFTKLWQSLSKVNTLK